MKNQIIKLAAAIILFVLSINLYAQGDLLITPYRVIFDESKNLQEISLANTGEDTSSYTVSFVQYKMLKDGTFEQILEPEEGQMFADKYLRIFPRKVTLAPNEAQIVRLQVRKSGDMEEGEYRSHLYFRSVPKEDAAGMTTAESDSSLGINLIPVFGITIPVIIRIGEQSFTSSISDASIAVDADGNNVLFFTVNRSGNNSVFGNISVTHISADGTENIVSIANGVSVYTPNEKRDFKMPLFNIDGIDYSSGSLKIEYKSPATVNTEIFCTYTLEL
ncbi:MAG: fimbria/pilus periplasmic chaperone [Bacteroidales bacterium]|nr:fimbria/pilus periplasmic chaperone [Bacteroidales bacterium]